VIGRRPHLPRQRKQSGKRRVSKARPDRFSSLRRGPPPSTAKPTDW
jgi:hypothetical protein